MRAILLLIAVIGANAVCAGKLDVAFLVDGSDSICGSPQTCDAWKSILNFIHHLVDKWEIGSSNTKVALVTFGDKATLKWNLNGFPDKEKLESEIDKVEFPGGELKDYTLVTVLVADIFYNVLGGQRSDAPDVVVLITDGVPSINFVDATAASTTFKAKGIKVFVVCIVTGCPEDRVKSLASPSTPNHITYFLVKNAGSIEDILEELLEEINATKSVAVAGII